jgi:hypothetical protein
VPASLQYIYGPYGPPVLINSNFSVSSSANSPPPEDALVMLVPDTSYNNTGALRLVSFNKALMAENADAIFLLGEPSAPSSVAQLPELGGLTPMLGFNGTAYNSSLLIGESSIVTGGAGG